MTIGDIMYDDLSLYPRLNRIIGQIGLPWYNIGGNHDLNYEAPSAKYSRETFKRIYQQGVQSLGRPGRREAALRLCGVKRGNTHRTP
jgi:hypothetical protein